MKQNESIRTSLADAFADLFDGGFLRIYSGAAPADPDSAASGTLLCEINLPTPAFGAAVVGVVSKSGVWSAVAGATATAGYARLVNAADTKWIQISIGEGSGELSLDETDIVAGNNVLINAFTYTQPES